MSYLLKCGRILTQRNNNLSQKWPSRKGTRGVEKIDFRLAFAKFIHLLLEESQTALVVTDAVFCLYVLFCLGTRPEKNQ